MPNLNAILSIHDVAPATLERVESIIARLPDDVEENLILLVIPGLDWQPHQIDVLRRWQDRGYTLAGHGWLHKTERITRLYHKLHSLFVSRDVAEHLSLTSSEIVGLMQRNYDWFKMNSLQAPDCYVPPAWALGKITPQSLTQTPYEFIETTRGYIKVSNNEKRALPLVGYEADTTLRKLTLLAWNAINEAMSTNNKPLRISIHPFDTDYLLSDSLWACLNRVTHFQSYRSVFQ